MPRTIYHEKVNLALAAMRLHGDTQEARAASARAGDVIDSAQWTDAGRRYRQEQGKLKARTGGEE